MEAVLIGYQCYQMAKLFFHFLALKSMEYLLNSIKNYRSKLTILANTKESVKKFKDW